MQTSAGRTVLSILASLAIASSLVTLWPVTRVSGTGGCPLNCSFPTGGSCFNNSMCVCSSPCRNPADGCTLCNNEGSCTNASVCSCFPCFSGSFCDTECSGNGTCTSTNSSGTCVCNSGFTGPQRGQMPRPRQRRPAHPPPHIRPVCPQADSPTIGRPEPLRTRDGGAG